MLNFRKPENNPIRECYLKGLEAHLSGEKHAEIAKKYYKRSIQFANQLGVKSLAEEYVSWIDSGKQLSPKFNKDNILDFKFVSNELKILKLYGDAYILYLSCGPEDKYLPRIDDFIGNFGDYVRAVRVAYDYTIWLKLNELIKIWHSVYMISKGLHDGFSHETISGHLKNIVGVVHNNLDENGIPIPKNYRSATLSDKPGLESLKGIRIHDGKVELVGRANDKFPPLITNDDLDIILLLVYIEFDPDKEFCTPSLTIESQGLGAAYDHVDTNPFWLISTELGKSFYFADWMMKAFTMKDGLPSITDPTVSAAKIDGWDIPELIELIGTVKGRDVLPSGKIIDYSRLEITLSEIEIVGSSYRDHDGTDVIEFALLKAIPFIESSLKHNGHHYKPNDRSTTVGKRASLITDTYKAISDYFPVFERVRILLALYSMVSQAKIEGYKPGDNEIQRLRKIKKNLFCELIPCGWSIPTPRHHSPRPFHKCGCLCSGGVRAKVGAKIISNLNEPILEKKKNKSSSEVDVLQSNASSRTGGRSHGGGRGNGGNGNDDDNGNGKSDDFRARAFAIKNAIKTRFDFNVAGDDPDGENPRYLMEKQENLIKKLERQDISFQNAPDSVKTEIVDLRETENGGVVFLQIGNKYAGLQHILSGDKGSREAHILRHTGLKQGTQMIDAILDVATRPGDDKGWSTKTYIENGHNSPEKRELRVKMSREGNGFIITAASRRLK